MLLLIQLNSATEKVLQELKRKSLMNGDIPSTGVGINLWVDGTYQNTNRTTAETEF